MRGTIVWIIVIFICICVPMGVLIAGDYYNLPLWPFNYFNIIIPVDFNCQITDPFPIPLNRVSSGNSFVIVDIRDENQNPIDLFQGEVLKTDPNGLLRIYLPEGVYMIRAHLIGVKGERIVRFGTGEPNEFKRLVINRHNNKIKLNLFQLKESDIAQMIGRMQKYIEEGYIDQALTLAVGLEKTEAGTAQDVNLKGESIVIKEKLVDIRDMMNQLGRMDIDSYNSKIILFQKILTLLKEIMPLREENQIQIIHEGQVVFPLRMIQALETTRNSIIQTHIRNIQEFIHIGKYSKATREWMWLKNNFELFATSQYLSQSSAALYEQAKLIIEEGQKQIYDHLTELYESAVSEYHVGNFERSREQFNQLYDEYNSLRGEFRIPEHLMHEVYSYIRDLMFIEKGYNDFLMKDYWNATESYKQIAHWTAALQSRMEEMRLPVKRPVQILESQSSTPVPGQTSD